MSEPLIQLNNVERFYQTGPTRTYVLRRIDATIRQGEFVTIMGPSGSGKSTLLNILGMLDTGWGGEYRLADHDVHKLNHKQRIELNKKYIGFVFQSYHLLDDLTVAENLDVPLSYRNVKKSERESLVADALDKFHIVGKKDLYPNQLSGGQQQLVAIARAVIASPKLVLADEPTGNLHTAQGDEIMALFQRLNAEGTTIIQVTHSERNAACGNRTINLADGWIVNPVLDKAGL
jgi:ABC-type lipoprotein export system ATPase subunit